MVQWTPDELDEAVHRIDKKASMDGEFSKRALLNPDELIREVAGKEAPDGCRLKIIEHAPEYDPSAILPGFSPAERLRKDLREIGRKLFS